MAGCLSRRCRLRGGLRQAAERRHGEATAVLQGAQSQAQKRGKWAYDVCTYVYVYIYIYIHTHIHTHIYIYIHIHIYTCLYIFYTYLYIFIHIYTYLYIFIIEDMFFFLRLYHSLCTHMYIYTNTYIRTFARDDSPSSCIMKKKTCYIYNHLFFWINRNYIYLVIVCNSL